MCNFLIIDGVGKLHPMPSVWATGVGSSDKDLHVGKGDGTSRGDVEK